jgi:hypothetical protein
LASAWVAYLDQDLVLSHEFDNLADIRSGFLKKLQLLLERTD